MAKKILTQAAYATDNIQNQADQVKGQATALKKAFDQTGIDAKTYTNSTQLVELQSETPNDAGANAIGAEGTFGTNNVGDELKAAKALIDNPTNVLALDNTTPYTPSGDYNPSTKKYADDLAIAGMPLYNPFEFYQVNGDGTGTKGSNLPNDNARDIARLELAVRKNGIVSGQYVNKYFESPEVRTIDSVGLIDFGKTYSATVNTGTNTLVVDSLLVDKDGGTPTLLSGCFELKEQITLQDGTSKENLIISGIDDGTKTLTFTTNIVGTYSGGANAYRSNMVVNGSVWNFGAYSAQTTFDHTTPVQVVNQAYSTQGNGGRKVVVLDNGWIITALFDSSVNNLRVYKSENEGDTFTLLTSYGYGQAFDIAMVSEGTNVYIAIQPNAATTSNVYFEFDAETVGSAIAPVGNLDTGQSEMKFGISLAISDDNTKITATWSSKNSSYPNSFNIRAVQGSISNGSVSWASVVQTNTLNTVGRNHTTPVAVYVNGLATITHKYEIDGSLSQILFRTSPDWGTIKTIYNGGSHTQSNPSLTFIPSSVATKINASYTSGLLVFAWHGSDSTYASVDNIRCKASSDNGVNWFDFGVTNELITAQNIASQKETSISWNNDGDVFIVWSGIVGGAYNIRLIERNVSTGYGSIQEVTSQTANNIRHPNSCDNFHDFNNPLTIYQDAVDSDVKFYGEWFIGTEIAVTEIDTRIKMSQSDPITSVFSYLRTKEQANLAIGAEASIVATASDESYNAMTLDDTIDLGNVTEYSHVIAESINQKVTVKYTMTRASTTDVIEINDFVGFVGV